MSLNATERLAECSDYNAQRELMFELVGDLSSEQVMHNRILVAIYIEPKKTKGGLILTDNRTKESVWQGTVGLVLKKGVTAFKDEPETGTFFHGQDVEVGEWVAGAFGGCRRIQINGVDCRLVEDSLLDAVVSDPNIVTHR